MQDFSNLGDLEKWANSPQGIQHFSGTEEVKLALKQAAGLLEEIMRTQIENYYQSYTPKVYERTYDFLYSLRVSPVIQNGNELSISVYFDPDLATHPSLFNGEDGFVPILLDQGWTWKNGVDIYHLSNYEGFNFIEKSIEQFNKVNRWGFLITKEGHHNGQSIW